MDPKAIGMEKMMDKGPAMEMGMLGMMAQMEVTVQARPTDLQMTVGAKKGALDMVMAKAQMAKRILRTQVMPSKLVF